MSSAPTSASRPLCTGHAPWWQMSRRECLNRFALGLGGLALADLLGRPAAAAAAATPPAGPAPPAP